MIPYWYQIGVPLFFLVVAGCGILFARWSERNLERQLREEAERKARPAE